MQLASVNLSSAQRADDRSKRMSASSEKGPRRACRRPSWRSVKSLLFSFRYRDDLEIALSAQQQDQAVLVLQLVHRSGFCDARL